MWTVKVQNMDSEMTTLIQKEPDQGGACASVREYCDNLLARSIDQTQIWNFVPKVFFYLYQIARAIQQQLVFRHEKTNCMWCHVMSTRRSLATEGRLQPKAAQIPWDGKPQCLMTEFAGEWRFHTITFCNYYSFFSSRQVSFLLWKICHFFSMNHSFSCSSLAGLMAYVNVRQSRRSSSAIVLPPWIEHCCQATTI